MYQVVEVSEYAFQPLFLVRFAFQFLQSDRVHEFRKKEKSSKNHIKKINNVK